MKSFKQYLTENKNNEFWHGSMSVMTSLRPGMHMGTKEQAKTRFADITVGRKHVPMQMHRIVEINKRKPEEHIEIEDTGSPTLGQALATASAEGRMPENISRIARKKSEFEQARVLRQYGIHRVYYKNKYEGEGISHIIVNPEDYELELEKQ